MKTSCVLSAAALFASAGLASAQITSIGPFTGPYTEGFETQTSPPFVQCIVGRIFNNTADLCTTPGAGTLITSGWGFDCNIAPNSGGFFYGSANGSTNITFDAPVGQFGGYFGTNGNSNVAQGAAVTFYDVNNVIIGTSSISFSACGVWAWAGWQSTTPVKTVNISGNGYGGPFVDMDDLQYGFGNQPVGACCLTNGDCIASTSAGCTSQGGTYHGDGSLCANVTCPQPPRGACCLGDGTCSVVTSAICATLAGVYNGDNSTCGAGTCLCTVLTDGGFETGSFSPDWTQFGDESYTSVGAGTPPNVPVHTGQYGAIFGPLTAGGIQTTLTVAAGTPVLVDFWYQAQGVTNSFSADLGTTNLIALTNDTSHTSWTEFTFTVPAPSDNPTLSFTFTNPPDYTYFDDVRVCIQQAAACYANCDHSTTAPCLNVLDFGCFLNKFAAGDTYANCDHSTTPPVLNVLDFGCFLNKFAAGCSNC